MLHSLCCVLCTVQSVESGTVYACILEAPVDKTVVDKGDIACIGKGFVWGYSSVYCESILHWRLVVALMWPYFSTLLQHSWCGMHQAFSWEAQLSAEQSFSLFLCKNNFLAVLHVTKQSVIVMPLLLKSLLLPCHSCLCYCFIHLRNFASNCNFVQSWRA